MTRRRALSLVLAAALTVAACITAPVSACLPCMNCASEVCCPPPRARAARVEILVGLGAPPELAEEMADRMKEQGVVFMPEELAAAIRKMVDHPGAREAT